MIIVPSFFPSIIIAVITNSAYFTFCFRNIGNNGREEKKKKITKAAAIDWKEYRNAKEYRNNNAWISIVHKFFFSVGCPVLACAKHIWTPLQLPAPYLAWKDDNHATGWMVLAVSSARYFFLLLLLFGWWMFSFECFGHQVHVPIEWIRGCKRLRWWRTLTSRRRDITEESFRIADEEGIFHTYKSSAMIMTYIIMDVIIGIRCSWIIEQSVDSAAQDDGDRLLWRVSFLRFVFHFVRLLITRFIDVCAINTDAVAANKKQKAKTKKNASIQKPE